MSNLVQEVKNKKKQIEELQRQKSRQEGQKEQLLKRLKDEFGINSTEEIQPKLDELGKQLVESETTFNKYQDEMDRIIQEAKVKKVVDCLNQAKGV